MKMTPIDFAIVFAVANVMLSGITIKNPYQEELYMEPPICNTDTTTAPDANPDPRCALLNKDQTPATPGRVTTPVQTPSK